MIGTNRLSDLFSSLAMIMIVGFLYPMHGSSQNALRDFLETCQVNETTSHTAAVFTPVVRDETASAGQWEYAFAPRERDYSKHEFRLGRPDERSISLVSVFDELPEGGGTHFWHLITVPNPDAANDKIGTGHFARYLAAYSDQIISEDELNTLRLCKNLSSDPGTLQDRCEDVRVGSDSQSRITDIWRRLFGQSAMLLLHGRDFTHTFIYQDRIQEGLSVGPDGYRANSSRIVLQSGNAYGFVLNHEGRCLAAADPLRLVE